MNKYEFLEWTEREVTEKMTGAVDFLRAYRDLCRNSESCDKCPIVSKCNSMIATEFLTDGDITELIREVMAQKRAQKEV